MNTIIILILMIFAHIVDDYYLQGILAILKQKSFWPNNESTNKPKYKYDYIVALIMHSFSWAFMIMLPILWFYKFYANIFYIIAFVVNMIIHIVIDDLKANKQKINLVVDQSVHMLQIIVTFIVFMILK